MAALPKVTASTVMGDTASFASGGSEVDLDVLQGRSSAGLRFDPPSGTSSALCSLPWCPAKALPIRGRVGHLQPHWLAEHRQSSTDVCHSKMKQDHELRAAIGSGVLSARLQPATDRCCVILDARLAPHDLRRWSRPDLEIPVCGVPEWGRCLGL
jgi:hypothetical protein